MAEHDMDSLILEDAAWEAECEEHLGELMGGMSWAESQSLRTAEDEGPLDDADPDDPDVRAWRNP